MELVRVYNKSGINNLYEIDINVIYCYTKQDAILIFARYEN